MQLVWSTLAGWLIFGAFPDRWALAGMIVIAASGVVLTWYERWRPSLPHSGLAPIELRQILIMMTIPGAWAMEINHMDLVQDSLRENFNCGMAKPRRSRLASGPRKPL